MLKRHVLYITPGEETAAGGGGGGGGAQPAPNGATGSPGDVSGGKPTLSVEEQMQRAFAAERKTHREELTKLREEFTPKLTELETLKRQNEEFRTILDERLPPPPDPEPSDDIDKLIAAMTPPKEYTTREAKDLWRRTEKAKLLQNESLRELTATVNELREQNKTLLRDTEERKANEARAREEAKVAGRKSSINSMISEFVGILLENKGRELMEPWLRERTAEGADGRLYFKPDPDSPDTDWLPYQKATIDKFMPDALRRSAIQGAGSGAAGGKQTPTPGQVDEIRQRIADTTKQGEEAARRGDRSMQQRAVKDVLRLKGELAAAEKAAAGR